MYHEIPGMRNIETPDSMEFSVPEIPIIMPDEVEEVEGPVLDTSVVGISEGRITCELVPAVEAPAEVVPESREEALSRRVDKAIAAAPTLEFTEDGSYPVVQVAGAVKFAEQIKNGPRDEIITVEPPEVIPPNIVTAPDLDSFEELVDISVGKLTETWPETERPDPDVMEILVDDIKLHERAHAEEAARRGLDATYALTFVKGEDGLSVGPSVILSGSATREEWGKVFSSPAEAKGPLDIPLIPSYLDKLYAPAEAEKPAETDLSQVDVEGKPAPSLMDGIGPSLATAEDTAALEAPTIRDIPAVQRPSGGLREEIRRLSDAIEEQEGIDSAELLSEAYEMALPLLRSDMTAQEIADQLGLAGKDISTQVSGLARRVLSQLTREASPEIVNSLKTEPSVGAMLQGLTKQAGVSLTEIRADTGVSIWSIERLFLGKERKDDRAFNVVLSRLVNRGAISQEAAAQLASKYFAERRQRWSDDEKQS